MSRKMKPIRICAFMAECLGVTECNVLLHKKAESSESRGLADKRCFQLLRLLSVCLLSECSITATAL